MRKKNHPVAIVALVLLLWVLISCSNTPSAPVSGGPYSQIAPQIQLPPGSRRDTGTDPYTREIEVWGVPGGLDEAVKTMRGRLPVGQPLDGLPWQGESHDAASTDGPSWTWANSTRQIYVGFMYLDVRGADNGVHIIIDTHAPRGGGNP